jgi:hypothetical protein
MSARQVRPAPASLFPSVLKSSRDPAPSGSSSGYLLPQRQCTACMQFVPALLSQAQGILGRSLSYAQLVLCGWPGNDQHLHTRTAGRLAIRHLCHHGGALPIELRTIRGRCRVRHIHPSLGARECFTARINREEPTPASSGGIIPLRCTCRANHPCSFLSYIDQLFELLPVDQTGPGAALILARTGGGGC